MTNANKVLFVSGRELNYPRNDLIIRALKLFTTVKPIGPHKHLVSRSNYFQIIYQSIIGVIKTVIQTIQHNYSIILIGFFGQFLVPPIARLTKKPIVFDFFISTWDTLVNDREKIRKNSLLSKAARVLDQRSCQSADLILVDTQASLSFYHSRLGVSKEKMKVLFVGCNEDIFYPRNKSEEKGLVLYYSSYMPLHGVDIVVNAAKLLEDQSDLHFRIIGEGQEYQNIQHLVRKLEVSSIDFIPTMPLADLPDQIAKASICLGGHFGASDKARRVIAGKTFQLLAMEKPTIVGDNDANRELLTHGQNAWFCKMNDPEALAEAILLLHKHDKLRKAIAQKGYICFKERASLEVQSEHLENFIAEYINLGTSN